jgi:hypothetical protein
VSGIVAGTLPWHDLDEALEAEYQGDVEQVPMPPWIHDVDAPVGPGGTEPLPLEDPELSFVAPEGIDAELRGKIAALGARPVAPAQVAASTTGTCVWLEPGAGPVPESLAHRGPASRVVLLPGPDGTLDASWALVDWVVPGPWPRVLADLQGAAWRRALS